MNYWIFQGNPDTFNIDTYLSENDSILWSVRQKHFAKEMHPGDEVYLWRAAGSKKAIAGVVAQAVVVNAPEMMADYAAHLWLPSGNAGVELRVRLEIQKRSLGS